MDRSGDYCLSGHMKQLIYVSPINTREELLARVTEAVETIHNNSAIVSRAVSSLICRAETCIENGGLHFELLL